MKIGKHYFLMMILTTMVALVAIGNNDPSLVKVHALGNVPYGVLWVLMNPLYWTNMPYKIFAFACQLAVLIPMLWLVKRGRLNRVMVYLFLLTNTYSMWFTGFGANSFMLFQPFAVISPLFALIGVLQVIPIWSLSLSDPHLQCFLGNCVAYTIPRTNFIHDLPGEFHNQVLMVLQDDPVPLRARRPELPAALAEVIHRALGREPEDRFWMVVPLIAWWVRRGASRDGWLFDETKFWLLWAVPLFALIVTTYVVYNFYGCCAAWSFQR